MKEDLKKQRQSPKDENVAKTDDTVEDPTIIANPILERQPEAENLPIDILFKQIAEELKQLGVEAEELKKNFMGFYRLKENNLPLKFSDFNKKISSFGQTTYAFTVHYTGFKEKPSSMQIRLSFKPSTQSGVQKHSPNWYRVTKHA